MKKFILILLVAMLANSVTASSIPTDTTQIVFAKPNQLKSNRQMTGGIIFMARGVLLSGIGAARIAASTNLVKTSVKEVPVTVKVTNSNHHTENSSFTTGIAAIVTGEPLFVVSSKNKRAFSVSTTEQVIKKMQRNRISRVTIPSIKLTIHL